jgi:hypothetical protein
LGELVEIARIVETAHAKARQEQERRSSSPRRPEVYPPPVLPLPAHMSRSVSRGLSAHALPAEFHQQHAYQYEPPTAWPESVCALRREIAPSRHRDCLSARCGRSTRREGRGANGRP